MLENSLWYRYGMSQSIRDALALLYNVDVEQFLANEGELYAVMKRQLTKRELRLFIMKESGLSMEDIQHQMGLDAEGYRDIERKTYRKFKIDKLKNALLRCSVSNVDSKTDCGS